VDSSNPKNFVKDEDTLAFVGVVDFLGQGPAELEYDARILLGKGGQKLRACLANVN
jgi:hypothetical protein